MICDTNKLNYLFSLPLKDGDPLSYGVSFTEQYSIDVTMLDSFLKEHSCFSVVSSSSLKRNGAVDWKEYTPRVDDYNGVLAKAIAAGTGHIVKGIFICSNAYTNQVQKGGATIVSPTAKEKNTTFARQSEMNRRSTIKKSEVNKALKRVRRLSRMTEKMSNSVLNGVGVVSGAVVKLVLRSQPCQ